MFDNRFCAGLMGRPYGRVVFASALTALVALSLLGDTAESHRAGSPFGAAPGDIDAELSLQAHLVQPSDGVVESAPSALHADAQIITVARGDTLMKLLTKAGVPAGEAHDAITAMKDDFSPRKLMPGQDIQLALSPNGDDGQRLLSLAFRPNVEQDVRIVRTANDVFEAGSFTRELRRETALSTGMIDSSLFKAARNAAVPMPILAQLIRAFSFDVDFQREIQPGDSFEVLYESFADDTGAFAKTGDLLYAALTLSGEHHALYRFESDGVAKDYFDANGQSVRKALMRTPIDGARLSSGFGMRKHPILGYSRMHKGTDFAAPSGTPIYAAGNGVIESIGRKGGYGKYIRIRHNGSFKTAYAHMKGFAKGLTRGKRVKQGQVIGYVGSTGRSTGPHLHYEVIQNGKQVNPLKVRLPSGQKLAGSDLEAFQKHRARIDADRRNQNRRLQLVMKGCAGPEIAVVLPQTQAC